MRVFAEIFASGAIDVDGEPEHYILNGEPFVIVRVYRADERFDYVQVSVVE